LPQWGHKKESGPDRVAATVFDTVTGETLHARANPAFSSGQSACDNKCG
jgi:hypothetical protein